MKTKFLAWVDLETTGTDEKLDPILEFGSVVTLAEPPFDVIFEAEGVFKPPELFFVDWRERIEANDFVREMHTVNGLLDAVDAVGGDIADFEKLMVSDLAEIGKRHEFMLAGSGVGHFDRRFLQAQMPDFESWMQYPVLDVGVIRRAMWMSGSKAAWTPTKPHRGLDDLKDHLEEFRHYARLMAELGA